jgi:hypothetical protein
MDDGFDRLTPDQQRRLRRIERLSRLMDGQWRIPGTGYRVGLDGLIGLIPGGGDTVGLAVSAYLLYEMRRLGIRGWPWWTMLARSLLDAVAGTVPIVGDLVDLLYKANLRNLDAVRDLLARRAGSERPPRP